MQNAFRSHFWCESEAVKNYILWKRMERVEDLCGAKIGNDPAGFS